MSPSTLGNARAPNILVTSTLVGGNTAAAHTPLNVIAITSAGNQPVDAIMAQLIADPNPDSAKVRVAPKRSHKKPERIDPKMVATPTIETSSAAGAGAIPRSIAIGIM